MRTTIWEYMAISYDLSELNKYGEAGWELVTVSDDRMFFKRPLGCLVPVSPVSLDPYGKACDS
jgi:hypothetical protein